MNDAKKITGGRAVYNVLKANGISTVFGLLGGSMLELYDAMHHDKAIDYVGARDERAAGHMADAYARMNGGPGVVLGAQAGPGVVNLVTAVAQAQLAYSPLVVIAGAISRGDLGKDTFQEMDQVALFQPIAKRSVMVNTAERLPGMLEDAIRLSMSGRRGPVVLHVPRDLMSAEITAVERKPVAHATAGPPAQDAINEILELLSSAKKPVIVAGGGFKWCGKSASLVALAEKLQIPVVASTGHADIMSHKHPLYAGQAGPRGNVVASGLTRDADCLLVIGARLAFNSTFHSHEYVSATAKIAHIDIEGSAIGRYFPADVALVADAGETADALLATVNAETLDSGQQKTVDSLQWKEWRDKFNADIKLLREERISEATQAGTPMHPRRALGEIREALPEDAIVTIDTGNACLQAADRLKHKQCPALITPLDFGLVGFSYAAAIGAKAAFPKRPVFCIIGDGGFGYTMTEITSAVRHNLPVIAIVLDNGAWGAEKAYQMEFFNGRLLGAEIDSPRYDKVAELCGAKGWYVDKPGQINQAISEAVAGNKVSVIHTRIDPDALSTLRKDLFKKPT